MRHPCGCRGLLRCQLDQGAAVALDLAGRVLAALSLRAWPGIPERDQRVIDPTTVAAENLYAAELPAKCLIVFGEESQGLTKQTLKAGDAASVDDASTLRIAAVEPSEVLVFDLA